MRLAYQINPFVHYFQNTDDAIHFFEKQYENKFTPYYNIFYFKASNGIKIHNLIQKIIALSQKTKQQPIL